jgi:hypothetical protein
MPVAVPPLPERRKTELQIESIGLSESPAYVLACRRLVVDQRGCCVPTSSRLSAGAASSATAQLISFHGGSLMSANLWLCDFSMYLG